MPALTEADFDLPLHDLSKRVVKLLFLERAKRELANVNAARRAAGMQTVAFGHLKNEPVAGAAARLAHAWLLTDAPLVESSELRAGDNAWEKAGYVLVRLAASLRLVRLRAGALPAPIAAELADLPGADPVLMPEWVATRDRLRAAFVGRPALHRAVFEVLSRQRVGHLQEVRSHYDDVATVSGLHGLSVANGLGDKQYPRNRPQLEFLRATVDAFLHDHRPDADQAAAWLVNTLVDLPWPPQETDVFKDVEGFDATAVRTWFLAFEAPDADYPDADHMVEAVTHHYGWAGAHVLPLATPPTTWTPASALALVVSCRSFLWAARDAGGDVRRLLERHQDALQPDDAAHLVLAWLVALCTGDPAALAAEDEVAAALYGMAPAVALRGCHAIIGTLTASLTGHV